MNKDVDNDPIVRSLIRWLVIAFAVMNPVTWCLFLALCSGIVGWLHGPEFLVTLPEPNELEGIYGFNAESQEEMQRMGYESVGDGQLVLHADGRVESVGGPLAIHWKAAKEHETIIPTEATTGKWSSDRWGDEGDPVLLILNFDESNPRDGNVALLIKRGTSGLQFCLTHDPDVSVPCLRRLGNVPGKVLSK